MAPGARSASRSRRLGRAFVAGLIGLGLVACDDPTAPAGGLTGASTAAGTPSHSHRAIVPFGDLDAPPPGGATYTSSTDAEHSHSLHLTASQLGGLQQRGATVSVVSGGGPGDHQHTFTFSR
jgi:hypothetical protein